MAETETKVVGLKRKGDAPEKSNPKKKLKRTYFKPCVIRTKTQEFFKEKSAETQEHIRNFFAECGVEQFKDFGLPERSLQEFINEHGICWSEGEITGPSQDWIETKLRTQMEFYFSDANLPRDKFLKNEIANSSERWVTLQVFKKFRMIQKWSDKNEDLVSALSKSTKLELDEKKKCVRRKNKCVLTKWAHTRRITLVHGFRYAKGKKNLEKMKDFFAQYGVIGALFPRKPRRGVAGSIEIVWNDDPTAAAFRAQKTVHYLDHELTINQTLVVDNFDYCYRFDNGEEALKISAIKQWLRDHGLQPKRVEFSGKLFYVFGNEKAVDVSKALENVKDKPYGTCAMLKEEEYDHVLKLMEKFAWKKAPKIAGKKAPEVVGAKAPELAGKAPEK